MTSSRPSLHLVPSPTPPMRHPASRGTRTRTPKATVKVWATWLAMACSVTTLGLSGCGGCGPTTTGDVDGGFEPDLALDRPLGDDEVRCGLVTKESELIGGPSAYGRVGRTYRCYNSKIRFLVQDSVEPVGSAAGGGTMIDVDLVRDDENIPGRDVFREFIFATGVQEITVERIEVVNDGSDGVEAVLRVEGHPAPLSVAPQAAFLRQDLPATVRHEFILKPASPIIELRTTVINEGDDQIPNLIFADAVAFGGANIAHNPTTGFADAPIFSTTPWIAFGVSENASYAYWCSDRDITLPFDSFGVKVAMCADDLVLVRELAYSRFFAVGDGTLDSVARLAMDSREIPSGTVTGHVERGGEVAPLSTNVFAVDSNDLATAVAVSQTRVDENGDYALQLPPGDYYILATIDVGVRSALEPISVDDDTSATVDLSVPQTGTLRVSTTFLDDQGGALTARPAKITLTTTDPLLAPAVVLGEKQPGAAWGAFPTPDGTVEITLPPGAYHGYVTRGFTYSRAELDVVIRAGETAETTATISRVLDTTGFVATEFHQHSLGSLDGSVPPQVRVLENAAEGIRFAATTDHDNIVDFGPLIREQGLESWVTIVPGNEVSYQSIGHFNVYPWTLDDEEPYRDLGVKMWWQKTAPDMFALWRERAGDPIVQVNHPRGGTAAFFSAMRLDPTTATRHDREPTTLPTLPPNIYAEWSSNFEAIEVDGDIGDVAQYLPEYDEEMSRRADRDPGTIPAFADFLALLGAGLPISAMGNSDSHHFNEGIGYPRSYVRVGDAPLENLSSDVVRDGIRGQDVTIANGCLVTVSANGTMPMGLDEAQASADGLRVKVQAPAHALVETVEVFINGRVQNVELNGATLSVSETGALRAAVPPSEEVVRMDASLEGIPDGTDDLVIIVSAHGSGGLAPTAGSRVYCISAPVYVDRGAPGFVGWHAATQTLKTER